MVMEEMIEELIDEVGIKYPLARISVIEDRDKIHISYGKKQEHQMSFPPKDFDVYSRMLMERLEKIFKNKQH